jgi:serine/threonine-protein phosphatase 6 regulatory ankyrin repeat subunit B
VNAIDQNGQTALMYAAKNGAIESVRLLVAAGARTSATDYNGKDVVMIAEEAGQDAIVQFLKTQGPKDSKKKKSSSPPPAGKKIEEPKPAPPPPAVDTPEPERPVKKESRPISRPDADLLEASRAGDVERVRELLLEGSDVNISTPDGGDTALTWASLKGHAQIAQMLIVAGANVNAKTKQGLTALMAASANGHSEIVEALLKAGAAVDEKRTDGMTALMFAVKNKHEVIIRQLVKAGATQ